MSKLPRDWHYYIDAILRWFDKEITIPKRVLRLRASLYIKIPWIDTKDMVEYLLRRGLLREVKDNELWLALPKYLDGEGQIREAYEEEFRVKREIYNKWNEAASSAGYYVEDIFKEAFMDAGYSCQKVVFDCPDGVLPDSSRKVEIDIFCVKEEWHLGVQVKNVTSDIFVNPNIIKRPSERYESLVREFTFCSRNRIIPILIAPFIEGSFYVFDDLHKGLHCRTYFQILKPEHESLKNEIKGVLRFGNIRCLSEVTQHIRYWISRIPETWRNRHGHW